MPNNFNYHNHNPNRRRYSNYYHRNPPFKSSPTPPLTPNQNLELPSDIPPSNPTPPKDKEDKVSDNSLNSLLGGFKGLKLDTDTLILLGLIYLLYKEDTSREHFKIILALGYILL